MEYQRNILIEGKEVELILEFNRLNQVKFDFFLADDDSDCFTLVGWRNARKAMINIWLSGVEFIKDLVGEESIEVLIDPSDSKRYYVYRKLFARHGIEVVEGLIGGLMVIKLS